MKYPSYPGMTDEELIEYIGMWWKMSSVKELIERYKNKKKECEQINKQYMELFPTYRHS